MFLLLILAAAFLLIRLRALSKRVDRLERLFTLMITEKTATEEKPPAVPEPPACAPSAPEAPAPSAGAGEPSEERREAKKSSVFAFLGQNLNVWIAAGAGLLGVFFFVKYSIDNSLISPAVRLILTSVAGCAAIAGGEVLFRHEKIANGERIAQVLTGVGLSALYFASYAVSRVYGLASPSVSIVLMSLATALAVYLCFRHNKTPLALLTIVGGFLTPALMRQATGDVFFFTAYGMVCAVVFLIIAKDLNSFLLGILTLVLLYVHIFLRIGFSYAPVNSVLFFCVGGTVFFASAFLFGGTERKNALLRRTAGGAVLLMMLAMVVKARYGLTEWGLTGLICLFLLIKAVRFPERALPLFAGVLLVVFLLMSLWTPETAKQKILVFGGFTAIALVIPYIKLWRNRLFTDFTAALLPVLSGLCFLNFQDKALFVCVCGVGTLLALAPLTRTDFSDDRQKDDASKLILSAAVLLAAGAFCSGFEVFLPLFFIGEAAVLSFVCKRIRARRLLVAVGGALALFAAYEYRFLIAAGTEIAVGQFFENMLFYREGFTERSFRLFHLVLPLIGCFGLYRAAASPALKKTAAAIGAFLAFFAVYLTLVALSGPHPAPAFSHQALITNLSLILALYFRRKGAAAAAEAFTALFVFRFVFADLIVLNPLISGRLSFPDLLWGYGFPVAVVCAAVLRRKAPSQLQVGAASFLFLALISFITTYVMFGTLRLDEIRATQAAVFAYSAVWLAAGVGELVLSLKIKPLTKPAFVLIYVVVAKVFLYDVSFLQDLWRVACLLGLAVSLLGIGHCHAKYFRTDKNAEENR